MNSEIGMVIIVLFFAMLGIWVYTAMRILLKRDARAWKKERW